MEISPIIPVIPDIIDKVIISIRVLGIVIFAIIGLNLWQTSRFCTEQEQKEALNRRIKNYVINLVIFVLINFIPNIYIYSMNLTTFNK